MSRFALRRRPRDAKIVAIAITLAAAAIAWSEFSTWRASRAGIRSDRLDLSLRESGDTVIVLGFRSSKSGIPNVIQRWRCRIAVRSADPESSTLLFTGGPRSDGGRSEAAIMAAYTVETLGWPRHRVRLEELAGTTWENIAFCIPLLQDAGSIAIASNTFHARRARRYLAEQSPELAGRLRRADDYRFGELAALKPLLALYEQRAVVADLLAIFWPRIRG